MIVLKKDLKYAWVICLFSAALLTTVGCETSSLSELAETEENSTDPITYANKVKSIFDNSCAECHNTVSANAGIMLDTYDSAKQVAESGLLIERMTSTSDPMPPSGNLPETVISDVRKWIDDGLLKE